MKTSKLLTNFLIQSLQLHNFILSKAPSSSSNSSSKLTLVSIKSIKLERDLQPILRPFGQFLLTKLTLSKFFNYKLHLLRLINIQAKENILSISIWDPAIPKIDLSHKTIVGNIFSSFSTSEMDILYF